MEFRELKNLVQKQFEHMIENDANLFAVDLDKDELWNLYLNSFPAGTNEIFRERRQYDCNCCKQFIRNIGNAVVIKNNTLISIWDFEIDDAKFTPVIKALSDFVKSKTVSNLFLSQFKNIGIDYNFEEMANGTPKRWEHFHTKLPNKFVAPTNIGEALGNARSNKEVFQRALEEITEESVLVVLEIISQNSLYRGEESTSTLNKFLEYKKLYNKVKGVDKKNNFCWKNSIKAGAVVSKIRNSSIGTLLVNISEGMDLDLAVKKYEQIVAPTNYKRPKAIFTKKMLEDAQKTITELGYMNSLGRRFATLEDITVNNILFSNRDAVKKGTVANIFDEMKQTVPVNLKKFSKIEEIGIEDFISKILPIAEELEVLIEGRHSNNLVSLIAPADIDSETMFKWDNNFSWSYAGNIADSDMKQNVKSAGGKVDGVLRFSIQWNDTEDDENDLDAHCIEPCGNEISFRNDINRHTSGNLDVDIVNPRKGRPAVENITWSNINKMRVGTYRFFVNCFSCRGGKSGFRAEIEFNGQVYSFNYNNPMKNKENVQVAEVTFDGTNFEVKELLDANSSMNSKEIWGVNTNQFVPVSVAMHSPNYWNEQNGIGNKHYLFMLKDCINNEKPSGFYNEFLKQELVTHKRVFEALGSKMSVESTDNQLSGLGFSSTKRNDLVVKVKGQTERVLKIKF